MGNSKSQELEVPSSTVVFSVWIMVWVIVAILSGFVGAVGYFLSGVMGLFVAILVYDEKDDNAVAEKSKRDRVVAAFKHEDVQEMLRKYFETRDVQDLNESISRATEHVKEGDNK